MTTSTPPKYVYKILRQTEWATINTDGEFIGSADDLRDGFIHLSLGSQVQGTLDKHYTRAKTNGAPIIIAEIDEALLGAELKYEISRGGASFPHLYGALKKMHIHRHWVLPMDSAGRYASETFLSGT
ncbi:MAG: DUF952 domain-containing protein [Maricaulaceae bacterium]